MNFQNSRLKKLPVAAAGLLIGVLLHGCASPTGEIRGLAAESGFVRSTVRAAGFALTVFANEAATQAAAQSGQSTFVAEPVTGATNDSVTGLSNAVARGDEDSSTAENDTSIVESDATSDTANHTANDAANDAGILHVYLEGDGSPWRYKVIIMSDPTPRRPLMLNLMRLDNKPAVYLGRPCYNGTAADAGCHSGLWTSGRYSPAVVSSMASAVRVLAKRHRAKHLRLFGHSGGGTLALLLAAELPMTMELVTLAGNLDTDAWTSHHGDTPLFSSLNPVSQPALGNHIRQWHLLGEQDGVVPPSLVSEFIMRQSAAAGFVLPGFNHGCCWQSVWPQVLAAVASNSVRQMPGLQFKFPDE